MRSARWYGIIWVLLMALAASKYLFFQFFDYEAAVSGTLFAVSLKQSLSPESISTLPRNPDRYRR